VSISDLVNAWGRKYPGKDVGLTPLRGHSATGAGITVVRKSTRFQQWARRDLNPRLPASEAGTLSN
jgi:hypothetical protein